MPLTISLIETGLLVKDKHAEHFVPMANIDAVWEIIKEREHTMPRQVWSALAEKHNLFPEMKEIIDFVKQTQKDSVVRDRHISALYEYQASAFEGRRVITKKGEHLNYYVLYWFPILFLKRMYLIEQNGEENIALTEKGKSIGDWKKAR